MEMIGVGIEHDGKELVGIVAETSIEMLCVIRNRILEFIACYTTERKQSIEDATID